MSADANDIVLVMLVFCLAKEQIGRSGVDEADDAGNFRFRRRLFEEPTELMAT